MERSMLQLGLFAQIILCCISPFHAAELIPCSTESEILLSMVFLVLQGVAVVMATEGKASLMALIRTLMRHRLRFSLQASSWQPAHSCLLLRETLE